MVPMMIKRFRYGFLMMGLLILLTGYNGWAYTVQECIECHKDGSPESLLHMPLEAFEGIVHFLLRQELIYHQALS